MQDKPRPVSCAGDLKARQNATVECTVTSKDGMKQRIAVPVTEVDRGKVSYDYMKLDGWNHCAVTARGGTSAGDRRHDEDGLDHAAVQGPRRRLVDLLEGEPVDQPVERETPLAVQVDQPRQEALRVGVALIGASRRMPRPSRSGTFTEMVWCSAAHRVW